LRDKSVFVLDFFIGTIQNYQLFLVIINKNISIIEFGYEYFEKAIEWHSRLQ